MTKFYSTSVTEADHWEALPLRNVHVLCWNYAVLQKWKLGAGRLAEFAIVRSMHGYNWRSLTGGLGRPETD